MKELRAEVHDEEFRNMLHNFANNLVDKTYHTFNKVGNEVVHEMQERLKSGDHIDTGNLADSIAQKTGKSGMEVKTTVVITARATNKEWYAKFIEHGTGIYNDTGTGRTDGWYYWYTGNKLTPAERQWLADHPGARGVKRFTYGQKADPFIEPTIDNALSNLGVELKELIYNTVRESK